MNDLPKVTIITVVYNSGFEIGETINSVLNQDYNNIEYIIIDGGSTDETLSIVNGFEGIDKVVSEHDDGIYHAMNKGINLAEGEWIGFLNAGDTYCHVSVVSMIMNQECSDADLIYGDRYLVDSENKRIIQKALPLEKMYYRMPFGHQAMFTKSKIMKRGFNLCYEFVADYEFVIHCYQQGYKFKNVNMPVCDFKLGGLSQINYKFVALEALYMLYKITNNMETAMNSKFYDVLANDFEKTGLNNKLINIRSKIMKIIRKYRIISKGGS